MLENKGLLEKLERALFGDGRNLLLETFPNQSLLGHFLINPGARSAPGGKQPFLSKAIIKPDVFSEISARNAPENPEIGHSF